MQFGAEHHENAQACSITRMSGCLDLSDLIAKTENPTPEQMPQSLRKQQHIQKSRSWITPLGWMICDL